MLIIVKEVGGHDRFMNPIFKVPGQGGYAFHPADDFLLPVFPAFPPALFQYIMLEAGEGFYAAARITFQIADNPLFILCGIKGAFPCKRPIFTQILKRCCTPSETAVFRAFQRDIVILSLKDRP